MQYKLKAHDAEISVQVDKAPDGAYTFTLGERVYRILAHRFSEHHLHAIIDGRSHHFHIAPNKDAKEIVLHGVPYLVEDASAPKRKKRQTDEATGDITPPMPGTIVRILVEVGQSVQKSQEVIVMSAMKMETTLYAPYAGIVKKILVSQGTQVMPGQHLIEIERSHESERIEPSQTQT